MKKKIKTNIEAKLVYKCKVMYKINMHKKLRINNKMSSKTNREKSW